ncbi:DUF2795 domain-containing protein [Cupriavidus gilardii]|uniref:DUF2795 domain-containing protein n=1 Tax=Cupriavidus gilardii TaxID=82541 RepID=A0A849BBK0_9BURK|nr:MULTISPECIES: DUF2795 domain-containing protein [Cupriavidus]ALD93535.1 hypothetical protein CR3_4355 [Cupriavidus gilardii CR3]QQE08853.1 DUF2795 domain-containing protein [Cupriavidus sp. ISTL7]ESJ26753.1 hypothetical protein B551_0200260 [Cupriavidus sp. HPC(L)]KAB0595566.1 DUF2795 domain-containing protein [Cupriavidus gilardii]MCD9119549.1 DUF2795 domain-containing protein [Cupriavidus sp. UGS-1]
MTQKQTDQGKSGSSGKGAAQGGKGGEGGREEPSPIDVQKSLKGIDFPATKDDILSRARDGGASEEVMAELEQLPERDYDSPAEISRELGKLH